MVKKETPKKETPKEYTQSDLYYTVFRYVVIGVVLLALFFGAYTTVDAGQRGVYLRFGEIQRVVTPGLVLKIPFIDTVYKQNVKTQVYSSGDTAMEAASSDSQDVYIKASFNYRILPEKAFEFYQRVGADYEITVVAPVFEQSVKASTVGYEAEHLLANRNKLKEDIERELVSRLTLYGIEVEGVNVENIDFRPEFRNAIERKAVAAQNLIAQERELEITKVQAIQAAEQAQGEANSALIKQQAQAAGMLLLAETEAKSLELRKQHTTTAIIELEWIKQWDGHLPPFQFGTQSKAMPIINIGSDVTEVIPIDVGA